MKDTSVDVKATLKNKTKVIIEMQLINHDGFESRILYNRAKNYSNQLERGDKYTLLNPIKRKTIKKAVALYTKASNHLRGMQRS